MGGIEEIAVLPVPMLECDIKVSPSVWEIEMPNLYSEAEGRIGCYLDGR